MPQVGGMPIHKFITKRSPVRHKTPAIRWRVRETTHMPAQINSSKWEIFAQREIKIKPRSSSTLLLAFGVQMASGICLISLRQKIKEMRCSLQDGAVSENVEDILVTIQNNSDTMVTIDEGDAICFVNYYGA